MADIYLLCGISKQAHHQAVQREEVLRQKEIYYIGFILDIREMHPGMGLRKIHKQFQPEGIGRDAFIALGLQEGFRLRTVSNPTRTTQSVKSARYRNLLLDKRFTDINQIWTSDITYFLYRGIYYYIVLIMDVYSRRIIGHSMADNLRAENNLKALQIALTLRGIKNYNKTLIHHSDRGAQYISNNYTETLTDQGIEISMCTDVLENAHIERVNGIIKNDYLARWEIPNTASLSKFLDKAVYNYNNRAHQSLENKTPIEFETYVKELSIQNRPQLQIYTINNQISDNPAQLKLFS